MSSSAESSATPDTLASRGDNRSRRPDSPSFAAFITSGWAPAPSGGAVRSPAADATPARRSALSAMFPGEQLVIRAGDLVTRSNDTDYRFRPHSAFAHLSGLGMDQEPGAVLVLHPRRLPATGHDAILYLRPLAARDTEEFYADSRHGEFWVGPRPTLADMAEVTGIATAHIDTLDADLMDGHLDTGDPRLAEAVSELRLIKDDYEVGQLRLAVAATIEGFSRVAAALPRAAAHERGERLVETTFDAQARLAGNAVGYETIAAGGDHATTLHWIRNDGTVRDGELLLLDAGVEVDSLYTADLTRTLPVSGRFTGVQRRVYQAVLDAADAAFAVAVPGKRFRDVHAAAMEVIADRLSQWGLLPGTAAESLSPGGQFHRRWMVHGTSHHLGLDVHDCAQARRELYLDAVLEPGMVFTIEPGLYFKRDDRLVPEEYRGIGIRIEDDVLITATGNENLSAALPRHPDDVEAWLDGAISQR